MSNMVESLIESFLDGKIDGNDVDKLKKSLVECLSAVVPTKIEKQIDKVNNLNELYPILLKLLEYGCYPVLT